MAEEEPVYRITLVRHAESTGNAEERLQGRTDYPLSERGRAQAFELARRWKAEAVTFDHVIASPLGRALETARIIAGELSTPDPQIDPLWIEQDIAAPAESDAALSRRGAEALASLLARPAARYLVVSHRALLGTVFRSILGTASRPDELDRAPQFRIVNSAFSRFRYFPLRRQWQVDVIGDRAHWKGEE
jgi:broad specificity phosphatase PhoE